MELLFNKYVNDLKTNNSASNIVSSYLNNMSDSYKDNNSYARIAIDYIAGMTDDYIKKEYNNYKESCHNKGEVSNGL